MMEIVSEIPQRALVIAAHPDDAELSAGGTIGKWSRLGCAVTIVVCTDGAAGSAEHDADARRVAARRRAEQEAAATEIGARHLVLLDNPDGGLEETADFRGAIVGLIREHQPEVVLSHDPYARDRLIHRDHRIAGQVTLDAVYPFARDHLHYPEQVAAGLSVCRVDRCLLWDADHPNAVVDISSALDDKSNSLQRHTSQIAGIMGAADPNEWLRDRGRAVAAEFAFEFGESFRMLHAPA